MPLPSFLITLWVLGWMAHRRQGETNLTGADKTLEDMFWKLETAPRDGCESCGVKVDIYFQLIDDRHGAECCRPCAQQHVNEVNAGVWEW